MQLNKTEALRQAQQLIDSGRVSSAIRVYQGIVEADPSDLSVISTLGDAYVKAGRVQDAVEHFIRIAENYLRNGSARSATHILRKILKLDPTAARAHMHLGELQLNDGKNNDAHASFIEAGAAYWHKGNIAGAIRMNELALASNPESRQAKTALALLQQEANQPEAPPEPKPATGDVEQILISIPDEPDTVENFVALYDGRLQTELPPDVDGLLSTETPIDGMSEDAIVEQIAIAELLVGNGQAGQAIALLRETLHHRPDHIQIRAKLKDIYLRTEMVERASEECLNIAAIFAARGEASRARDYVVRARALTTATSSIPPIAQNNEPSEAPREEGPAWSSETPQPLRVM